MITNSLIGWILLMAQVAVLVWMVWYLFKKNGLIQDIQQLELRVKVLKRESQECEAENMLRDDREKFIEIIRGFKDESSRSDRIERIILDKEKINAMSPELTESSGNVFEDMELDDSVVRKEKAWKAKLINRELDAIDEVAFMRELIDKDDPKMFEKLRAGQLKDWSMQSLTHLLSRLLSIKARNNKV